jgi:hypothetical protein
MNLNLTNARRVAAASSEHDGRGRWTELAVYHFADGMLGGKVWVSEIKACSAREGERTKTRRLHSASLERALGLFDDSDLGRAVSEAAREYAEDEGIAGRRPGRQVIPDTDRDALAWLYGVPDYDVSIREAARALGANEATMRAAIMANRPIKISLSALLPFVDRIAFQKAMEKDNARG